MRLRDMAPALALAAALLPSGAQAGWGDENWGELVWNGVVPPGVPGLGGWGLLLLAFLIGLVAPRLIRSRAAVPLVLLAVAIPLTVMAAQIGIPNTFFNGTLADANDVNANFQALVGESNDQDVRIGDLEMWGMDIDAGGFNLTDLGGSTGASSTSVLFDYSNSTQWELRGPETLAGGSQPFVLTWPTTNKFGVAAPLLPVDLQISTTRLELPDGWDTVLCIGYNQLNCGGSRIDLTIPGSKFQWEHDYAPSATQHFWEILWDLQTASGYGFRPFTMTVNMADDDPVGAFQFTPRPAHPFPKACEGGGNPKSFCRSDADCTGGGTCTGSIGRRFQADNGFQIDQLPVTARQFNHTQSDGTALRLESYAIDRDECAAGPGTCGTNFAGARITPDFETNHEVIDYRYLTITEPTGTSTTRPSNVLVGLDIENLNNKTGGYSAPIRIADQSTGSGASPLSGNLLFLKNGLTGNHVMWGQKLGGNFSHLWTDPASDRPCYWSGRRSFAATDTDSPCANGGSQVATHQPDEVIGVPVWAVSNSSTRFCDGSARPAGFFCSSDTDCAGGTCSKLLNTGDNICEAKGEMKCISDSVIEFGTGAGTLASLEQRACSTTLTDGAMTIVACHQSTATR